MRRFLPRLVLASAFFLPALVSAAPGELRAVGVGTQGNNYGYWEYLPAAYDESETWPLFVFLGGVGEVGTGQDDGPCSWPPPQPDFDGESGLCNHLRHGPQQLIYRTLYEGDELWDDTERPFVVIAPQNPLIYSPYDPIALGTFFDYLQETYSLDERRLYLVGMSEGGHTIATYLMTDPDRLAAVAPLAGFINDEPMQAACTLNHQAIWMFHGEDDLDFHADNPIAFWTALNECPAPHSPAKVTIYLNAQHDVWTRTINPALGMQDATDPAYDPYDVDLYSWLLTIDKPMVDAGEDVVASDDDAQIQLTATVEDDDAVTWEWTQISGAAVAIEGDDTATPTLTGYAVGELSLRVRVIDADGQFDEDEVTVTIQSGQGGGTTDGSDTDGATEAGDDANTDDDGTGGSDDGDCTTKGGDGQDDGDDATGGPTTAGGDADGDDDGETGDDDLGEEGDDCGSGSHDDGEETDDTDLSCSCTTDTTPSPMAFGLLVLALTLRPRRRR